ncbi:hypothetical protein BDY24DRAFT_379588 [Mrakia frigida]|uniref:uncharacterized protein n=1 Tax=Mrakia frigida TaxID=29902 RepID=UPI003FCC00AC
MSASGARQGDDRSDHRLSSALPLSSPPFSHPTSTSSSTNQPPKNLPPISLGRDLYSRPNPFPFKSGSRSSDSQDGIRISPFEENKDEFSRGRESGSSGGTCSSSGGEEMRGFFNNLNVVERIAPSDPPISTRLPRPSSAYLPSSSSHSHLPLPSPLLTQRYDTTRPSGWAEGEEGWDSVNPFADTRGKGETKPVAFTLVKCVDEGRTQQACQACRARKSKVSLGRRRGRERDATSDWRRVVEVIRRRDLSLTHFSHLPFCLFCYYQCDGQAPCIRCQNKKIQCIYATPPPYLRGKRPGNPRSTSSSSLASYFTRDALVQQPSRILSTIAPKSDRGIHRSRRRSSDGDLGGETEGWESKGRMSSVGRVGPIEDFRRTRDTEIRSSSYETALSHHLPRPQLLTDPSPLPSLTGPFGSSHSTPPSEHHFRSYQSFARFISHSNPGHQSPPPPPPPRAQYHPSGAGFSPPPSPHPIQSYGNQAYPILASGAPTLHPGPPLPPPQPLLFQQSNASSSSYGTSASHLLPPTEYYNEHHQYYYHPPPRPLSSSDSSTPSALLGSHSRGGEERSLSLPSLTEGGSIFDPPFQQVWGERSWQGFGYFG